MSAVLSAFLLVYSQQSSLSDLRLCHLMLVLCLKPSSASLRQSKSQRPYKALVCNSAPLSLSLPHLLLHFSSLCFSYTYPYYSLCMPGILIEVICTSCSLSLEHFFLRNPHGSFPLCLYFQFFNQMLPSKCGSPPISN